MIQSILLPRLMDRTGIIARIGKVLTALPIDKAWRLNIEESKPTRSPQQNKLLWAIYGQIIAKGGETMSGWDKEDLHDFFLLEHFGGEPRKLLGRTRMVPNRRSSRLNKQEFSDYVDHIVRFMAERAVFIDLPSDEGWR